MASDVNNAKDNYLKWLPREIDRNQTYHNHKETMAWTATAFYIPGIILLGYYAGRIAAGCWQYVIFTALFLIALFLAVSFICMQFRNRWIAANRVAGLIRSVSRLSTEWVPTGADLEIGQLYPRFVEQEIQDERGQGRLQLDRVQTEYVTYGAVALATVVALVLLYT